MNLPRHRALTLLDKCRGDEIWSVAVCLAAGVPQSWIDEMSDTFESGFRSDRQTIYVDNAVTNQYHGVRDVDLALRLARVLGVDVDSAIATSLSRESVVAAIKAAVFEE